MRLDLPWPPSMNRYWRSVVIGGRPRVLLSRVGREFKERVATILQSVGVTPTAERVALHIVAHPPTKRRTDIDNILKALLDSISGEGGVMLDDSQVDYIEIARGAVKKDGAVSVYVQRVTGDLTDIVMANMREQGL